MAWENLGTLYHYELKKIVRRRTLWITLALCISMIAFSVISQLFGAYYVDGELSDTYYHMYTVDPAYREELSGRVIDDELLQEMVAAYRKIPAGTARYTLTKEYQVYARLYNDIFGIVRNWTGMGFESLVNWNANEEDLYALRRTNLEKDWQELCLTDAEKAFWIEQESHIAKPITYFYHDGYSTLVGIFQTVGILMFLLIAITLSSVFSDEHTRRTDQLILSSMKGKGIAYWAKLLAGGTVSAVCALILSLAAATFSLGIYGATGFHAALQLEVHFYSWSLSLGEACLIMYGALIITSLLAGVFVMVLSELLHSNIGALAVSTGLILLAMFVGSLPDEYRVIAQIWDSLPMVFLSPWNVFSVRPITLLGYCLTSWQVMPIIYIICSFLIAILGKHVFGRYQVSGR